MDTGMNLMNHEALEQANFEEWKIIPWANTYDISNLGRVRRISSGRILKPSLNHRGYPIVGLSINGKAYSKLVHRLMVDAFLGGLPTGMTTNHINAIKTDNRLCNLEILTQKENTLHKWKTGTMRIGEGCRSSKLDVCKVLTVLTHNEPKGAFSARSLGDLYGVHHTAIRNIRKKKDWRCVWMYLEKDFDEQINSPKLLISRAPHE